MRFQQSYCVLDEDLRLLWVGGDWDEFALSNGGQHCLANEVLATRLPDHICDTDTTEAILRMVSVVQKRQREVRIDYRCDSPTTSRLFRMSIVPMKDHRVLMVHDLRDARSFDRDLGHWKADVAARDCKCSFCCAVQLEGAGWVPPETLPGTHPERVRYTLCPDCLDNVARAIERAAAGASPTSSVADDVES